MQERLYGFGACLAIAFVISFMCVEQTRAHADDRSGAIMFVRPSLFFFRRLIGQIIGQTAIFSLFFTIGVIISLVGTGFLLTFSKQVRRGTLHV